jgi:histidinol-phosphatase
VNTVSLDLAFAHRLADAADTIALRHFVTGDAVWRSKSDGSPVSIADEQIEHTLRTVIGRDHPGDAVLGEEFGATGADGSSTPSTAPPASWPASPNGAP